MKKSEAYRTLRESAKNDEDIDAEEGRAIFRAIFGREPDDEDGDVVSHCFAALHALNRKKGSK